YSIDIDGLVRKAVREIYGSRGEELINAHLFEITNTALQQAVDTSLSGIAESDPDFVQQFKENTAVFAAFKNHQQTKEIAALLYDENGKLKPFYKFRREALQISKDYNVTWLQTEYNTAVRAARMAANMKKYKKTSHLYPNLEYIETSSAHPRASHLSYVGTILPIEHPWWNDHLPPSDWNCACSVRPTDKPATPVPDGEYTPPVFRNNPERTAEFLNIKETAYCKHTAESLEGEIKEVAGDLLRTSQCEVLETYEGKNGGYLKVVKQNKAERDKNLITYKIMADNGGRYSLLEELPGDKVKNPDAFNFKTLRNSEAKHPITPNGQKAIQRSIEQAAKQADEIVIRLNQEYPSYSLYRGLYAALQNTHTQNVKVIFILRPGRKPLELDADKLRSRFFGK
ncbi:MAG: hypothetical protein LBQ58_10620, partial [Synergistaceae bacterium]|nr:hypothetical protein [Synergistaceae bacterium]